MDDQAQTITCETCKGSGWNQDIKKNPVDITVPIGSRQDLTALRAYSLKLLCCPDCSGTGKRLMTDDQPNPINHRVPKRDDAFLTANAGRMFELLSGVNAYPLGYPLNPDLMTLIWDFFGAAHADGIDTIAVSEAGLAQDDTLRIALARSVLALDDLLNIYTADQCDLVRVKEAQARVGTVGGTCAYVADVQKQNREALCG